jgi:hypothetical protein
MEGVLEGYSEKGSCERTFKKERNTYLGRAIIRGSLCLLTVMTRDTDKWLLELFSDFFWRTIERPYSHQIGNDRARIRETGPSSASKNTPGVHSPE